jgi:hypothetical protein
LKSRFSRNDVSVSKKEVNSSQNRMGQQQWFCS